MNFKGDFLHLGNIDVTALKQKVKAITDAEWEESSWREKKFDTHADTQTIQLIFDTDFRHSNPTCLPRYEQFRTLLEPLVSVISRHYNNSLTGKRLQKKHGKGYVIRMIMVRLAPGGVIPPHGDQGHSLLHAHRVHLSVVSEGNAQFSVGDSTMKLEEGGIWEINNKRTHAVTNQSATARIHIITDWVIPGERCCCGKKHRPQGVCGPQECAATDNAIEECDCYPH